MTAPITQNPEIRDVLNRPKKDLRLSVIDACNFRCNYCLPAGCEYSFFKHEEILSVSEIERLVKAYVKLGVKRVRLTGGEPLLRQDLCEIIKVIDKIDGVEDLSLTTNGMFLEKQADQLKAAGLKRVTVSLDSLNPETFRDITGGRGCLEKVLRGIDAALDVGLTPLKINSVIEKGKNDHCILPLAQFAKDKKLSLRFIEFMDVGNQNQWDLSKVFYSKDILKIIKNNFTLKDEKEAFFGEVANRYSFAEGGELGFISSVSQPFCHSCTRVRVSADGKIYNCLFSGRGSNIRHLLGGNTNEAELLKSLTENWTKRRNRYSEERLDSHSTKTRRNIVEMFKIGG